MFLELICLLCGASLSITGSLIFWKVINWFDFYRPIVLFIAGWIAGIGVIFIIELIAAQFIKKNKVYNRVNKWAKFWFETGVRFITNHALIWTKVRGIEKVPQKERFVIVCNHRSKFDNFIITKKLGKQDVAFITKKENGKIPIAGRMMNGLCYLSIDRDDKLQSLEAFRHAVTLLETNAASIGIFPEGTRQTERVIGEFHEGTMNIPIHAKAPIVVTTMKNTERVHKNWPFKVTKVKWDIIAVLNYEDYQGMTAKALSDMIHDMMEEHLQQM